MWCLPEINDAYIEKMEDVLALYAKPYDPREPVVCLDEKPVTLHAEVGPRQAARPGVIAKRDSAYKRCGDRKCVLRRRTPSGPPFHVSHTNAQRRGVCPSRRKARPQLSPGAHDSLGCRQSQYPPPQAAGRTLRRAARGPLVGAIQLALHAHTRSWLNQAEIEIGLFSRQCLGTRRINRDRVKINWKFSRQDARSVFHY